jgi:hypothetical protein
MAVEAKRMIGNRAAAYLGAHPMHLARAVRNFPPSHRAAAAPCRPEPAECPGGCFTCAWFGHRVDVAVWCGKPGQGNVRSQAERGCAFWMREPGTDDELPMREISTSREVCIAPALLLAR